MKWTDNTMDLPPSVIWRKLCSERNGDLYGWLTVKQLQDATHLTRDVIRQVLFRFLNDGSVERCGVRGRRCYYRKK